jgi:hypothetical protein
MESGPAFNHRDTYLEQRQTEKSETEVRDVDGIQITKVYPCCPGWPSGGGNKSAPDRYKHMLLLLPAFSSPPINEDLLGWAAAGVYFQ